jgi:GT2 family glycosyltransferase
MPARWLFVTVSDSSEASRERLGELLDGVERQGISGDLVLVMRGGDQLGPHRRGMVNVHPVDSPLQIGLSRARNLGLAHAEELGLLGDCAAISFPDDDACYPDGLLSRVGAVLDDEMEIVCGPYAPDRSHLDLKRFPLTNEPLTPSLTMRVASSNNLFFRAEVVRAVGPFDELFGLGARYGAAEDSDYVLRALASGFRGVYDPEALVQHPYKRHRVDEYYHGTVAVLAKHARGGGTSLLLVRRLAGGVLLAARRRLAVADYVRTVVGAVGLAARRPR